MNEIVNERRYSLRIEVRLAAGVGRKNKGVHERDSKGRQYGSKAHNIANLA